MKRYCLTECFKKKLSKVQEILLAITIVIAVVIAGLIALTAILYGIGYIAQTVFGYWFGNSPVDTGIGILVILLIISFITYWGYIFTKFLSKAIYHFTKDRIEGEKFECSIFEECKEELEEENIEDIENIKDIEEYLKENQL